MLKSAERSTIASTEALKMARYCSSLCSQPGSRWRRSLMSRSTARACGAAAVRKGHDAQVGLEGAAVRAQHRGLDVRAWPASARRTMSSRART